MIFKQVLFIDFDSMLLSSLLKQRESNKKANYKLYNFKSKEKLKALLQNLNPNKCDDQVTSHPPINLNKSEKKIKDLEKIHKNLQVFISK